MLPDTRNRTYGTDTPVHPGDLNDLQDAVVSGKHGDRRLMIPGSAAIANSNVTRTVTENTISTTGNADVSFCLPMHVGDRIKSIKVVVSGNAAADISGIDLIRVPTVIGAVPPAVAVTIGSVVPAANTPNLITEIDIDNTDYTLTVDNSLSVRIPILGAGLVIYRLEVLYDHP